MSDIGSKAARVESSFEQAKTHVTVRLGTPLFTVRFSHGCYLSFSILDNVFSPSLLFVLNYTSILFDFRRTPTIFN